MTFGTLAAGWVVAGLAALAGVLYLLQRLRVRHREQAVVTTLFWHEAVRDERVRVLTGRFRHPLAYLLALLIAGLIWFAVADPRVGGSGAAEVAILIDGSAGMARGDRFEVAVADALEAARSGPRGRTRVILCGGRPRTLLARGEDVLLLQERLEGAVPEACPATVAATIEQLAATARPGSALALQVAGDAAVTPELLALLPEAVDVSRIGERAPVDAENRGITALGVTEPASGRWGVVDVLVTVQGWLSDPAPRPTIDGQVWDGQVELRVGFGTGQQVVFIDVPARGGRLEFSIADGEDGDGLAIDDRASVILPDRPPIRVRIGPRVPPALEAVLAADPAVSLVDADAAVEVLIGAEGTAPAALRIQGREALAEAIQVRHDPAEDSELVLQRAVTALGLSGIDAPELAQAIGSPIQVGALPSSERGVAIWAELLDDRAGFVHSRAFPLFVVRSIRWLAGVDDVPPARSAGRLLPPDTSWTDSAGKRLDGVGSSFAAPVAGDYIESAGVPVAVSLLDLGATLGAVDDEEPLPPAAIGAGGFDLVSLLGLLALGLLGFEWALFRTGRMP